MTATTFLNSTQQADVEKVSAEAEKRTAAEIVCAVATESGRYDRAESLVGLLGALVGLGIAAMLSTGAGGPSGSWSGDRGLALGWQCFAVVAGFVAGSLVASYFHPLRALFTSAHEMEQEAARAASHVFASQGLGVTRSRGGLLLYVTLYERRVVVLADKAVMDALGEGFPRELRDIAVRHLREGRRGETFLETIQTAADRLAPSLPVKADDADELSNRLVIYHPRP